MFGSCLKLATASSIIFAPSGTEPVASWIGLVGVVCGGGCCFIAVLLAASPLLIGGGTAWKPCLVTLEFHKWVGSTGSEYPGNKHSDWVKRCHRFYQMNFKEMSV